MMFDHEQSYLAEHSLNVIDFWSRVSDQKLASF